MTQDQGQVLGWDSKIDNPDEGDFTLFPDGIYPFSVTKFERGRHEASDNLPECPMAKVYLEFDGGPQLGTTTVMHRLFLHTKTQGMLAQFFKGIGLRKHGEPLVLDWNAIHGRKGYAKLGTRKYNNEDYQKIKKFIPPEDWPTTTPAQVVQQPAQPAPLAQPVQPAPPVQQPPEGAPPF